MTKAAYAFLSNFVLRNHHSIGVDIHLHQGLRAGLSVRMRIGMNVRHGHVIGKAVYVQYRLVMAMYCTAVDGECVHALLAHVGECHGRGCH